LVPPSTAVHSKKRQEANALPEIERGPISMNLSGKRNPLAWADFSSTDTLEQPKITTLSQDTPTSQLGFSSSDASFALLHSS
jgi:hypothetical protein